MFFFFFWWNLDAGAFVFFISSHHFGRVGNVERRNVPLNGCQCRAFYGHRWVKLFKARQHNTAHCGTKSVYFETQSCCLQSGVLELFVGADGFYQSLINQSPRPQLSWEIDPISGVITAQTNVCDKWSLLFRSSRLAFKKKKHQIVIIVISYLEKIVGQARPCQYSICHHHGWCSTWLPLNQGRHSCWPVPLYQGGPHIFGRVAHSTCWVHGLPPPPPSTVVHLSYI